MTLAIPPSYSSGQGLRTPGELKVQVIKDFPIPTNKTQVRAFLGLSGYYRRYIREFSVIAAPLTDLLKGRNRKSTADWNSSCQNAFEELKTRLSNNPVLYSPDFTKPFIIQWDASNLGIGVVLLQVCENEEHPIMFLSKKLSLAEQKYSTTEKECAAIIFAVQKLKCYLDGHQKFVIQTHHNPLVWLEENTGTNPRLLRHLAEKMGTPYLQRMLQKTLRSHIKAALPDLRNKLAEKLSGYNKKLNEFSIKMGEESGGKQYYMIK
ncbi:retrovirus-related Pol polyprotein from transposon 297 [Trichonephila clavipes]|nr:retrovirus-related Pol polyprotein from transposon 297 [Trichonephila clavipes]